MSRERQRRYRGRAREGILVVPIEVHERDVEMLIATRLIDPVHADSREKIAGGVQRLIHTVRVDWERDA